MDVVYRGCVSFYSFTLPVCKAGSDFRVVFKDYLDDEPTKTLVQATAMAKAAMLTALVDRSQSYEQRLVAVDQYLSALSTVHESLLAQGGVKVSQTPLFEWMLYINGAAESFRSSDMVFELVMLLHLRALLHFYLGRALLESDVRSFLSEAGKNFLVSASVMDYLQQQLVPEKWARRFHASHANPLETSPQVCAGMGRLYRLCAQSCAALKACENAAASHMVRSRVAVAAVNQAGRALELLREGKVGNGVLLACLAVTRELFAALALLHLARHSYDKQEVGSALGLCSAARGHLAEQGGGAGGKYDPLRGGLPKPLSLPNSSSLSPAVAQLLKMTDELSGLADRDNRFVHFQTVQTPPLPEEAAVLQPPAAYAPSPLSLVAFKLNQRTSLLASIFGFGKKGGAAAGGNVVEVQGEEGAGGEGEGGSVPELSPPTSNTSMAVYPGLKKEASSTYAPSAPSQPLSPHGSREQQVAYDEWYARQLQEPQK